ncbi:chemotaxis protein CheW [Burkholderia vietnamiensis]|jgi:chemotaxis-related protein WspB|uniref:CheW protein n=2 Tax=Burkholderia vietnamiensis TaxID=60552 RepID=A4JLK1_BURVG|nr:MULTISPECIES: chemotaxis protein CheW [Burkholderia]ABO57154.1 CheW protein [Burkholderia vietnamiensis G4]AJY04064.1 cheW-like domain protein [Burkholderia vietnamiensis LMG 10929]AOJ98129.1 chemotaxis protein CheW [Burkholderia vietnamiensis]AOK42965.1 chemotaxis protein CheW [Burkholderia vietnamiensis]AVR13576.1 chemotaxis protein CheW [Burkholderia vietnamiensis]
MMRAEPHGAAHALFLMFELDGARYALDAADVDEVLPLAATTAVAGAPAWIAGLLMRGAQPVPVIDLPMLALGRPAQALRSTRLVMVRYRGGRSGRERVIGLIVERATRTLRIDRAAFRISGVSSERTRWLGRVANTRDGVVQQVSVAGLVDDVAHLYLFDGQPAHEGAPG